MTSISGRRKISLLIPSNENHHRADASIHQYFNLKYICMFLYHLLMLLWLLENILDCKILQLVIASLDRSAPIMVCIAPIEECWRTYHRFKQIRKKNMIQWSTRKYFPKSQRIEEKFTTWRNYWKINRLFRKNARFNTSMWDYHQHIEEMENLVENLVPDDSWWIIYKRHYTIAG